jgi:hypothetical protein
MGSRLVRAIELKFVDSGELIKKHFRIRQISYLTGEIILDLSEPQIVHM